MTVYCNCGLSPDYGIRNKYVVDYMSGLIYYYQNLSFGEGVKEVVYYLASGDEEYLRFIGTGTTYGRRNKSISCIFFVDYEARKLEVEELLRYMSKQLIKESEKFTEKKIKNFDLEGYIKSLEEYFAEAIQLLREGKNPGEGKELNEDIQLEMAKKWSKL